VKAVQQELGQAGIEMLDSDLTFKFVPDEDEIKKCIDFGKLIAKKSSRLTGSLKDKRSRRSRI
jgi:hypothetical protein